MKTKNFVWIGNDGQGAAWERPGLHVINDLSAFQNLKNEEPGNLSGIVLLSELSWEASPLSRALGMKLLKQIRVDFALRCPVLLVSLLPEAHLRDGARNPYAHYLQDQGVAYLSFAEYEGLSPETLQAYLPQPLNEQLWKDYVHNLYRAEGYLEDQFRLLFREVSRNLETHLDRVWEQILHRMGALHPALPGLVEKYQEQLKGQRLDTQGKLNALQELKAELREASAPETQGLHLYSSCQVLVIEGQPGLIRAMQQLNGYSKLEWIAVDSEQAALKALENDKKLNRITVIVCPFRLLNEKGQRTGEESYQIFNRIDRLMHYHTSLLLLEEDHHDLPEILGLFEGKVIPFVLPYHPKEARPALLRLSNRIKTEHLRIKDEIANQPDWGGGKDKSEWKREYFFYRNHENHAKWDRECSWLALEFWHRFVTGGNYHSLMPRQTSRKMNSPETFREKLKLRRTILTMNLHFPRGKNNDKNRHWVLALNAVLYGLGGEEVLREFTDSDLGYHLNTNLKIFRTEDYHYSQAFTQPIPLEEKGFLRSYGPLIEAGDLTAIAQIIQELQKA